MAMGATRWENDHSITHFAQQLLLLGFKVFLAEKHELLDLLLDFAHLSRLHATSELDMSDLRFGLCRHGRRRLWALEKGETGRGGHGWAGERGGKALAVEFSEERESRELGHRLKALGAHGQAEEEGEVEAATKHLRMSSFAGRVSALAPQALLSADGTFH